jgi:hypothetical protein
MHHDRKIGSYFSEGALIAALAIAAAAPALLAQNAPARKWSVLPFASVKPDSVAEFEAWQKEMTAAYKKADVPSRAVVQTIMGDLFEYISIYPISHFADLDGPTPVEHALGKEEADKLMRKGRSYIVSARRITSLAADDLSLNTPTPVPAPYALVTIVQLVQGKSADFDAWTKNEYLPMLKKGGMKNYWVSRTLFGGDPDERVMVRPLEKMAEIDAGPVAARVLGEEGGRKLMSGTAGFTKSVQYRMVRYRADLSYDMTADRMKTSDSAK